MTSHIQVQRICKHCGDEFTARTTVTQYCGEVCAKRAYKARLRQAKIEHSEAETKANRNEPLAELQAKEFLGIAEACQLLGVSRWTLHRAIKRGVFQTAKLGRRTIIRRASLEALFGSNKTEGIKDNESNTQRKEDFIGAQEFVS